MKRYLSSNAAMAWLALLCAVGALAPMIGGCGSASQTVASSATTSRANTGRAVFTIKWPARTPQNGKLIPADSNSIIVTLAYNGATVATQIASRPASGGSTTLTFPSLPVGQIGVTAVAVPDTTVDPNNPTVHGTAQASGAGVLNVTNGGTATITVTMNSTIAQVEILPATLYMQIGTTTPVSFEALDSSGDMVLVSPSTVLWSVTNTTFATVTPNSGDTGAVVIAVSSGDTFVNVTETESGQSASIPVSVRGPLAKVHITTINPAMNVQGVGEFGIVAEDSAGNIILGGLPSKPTWTSSNSAIASIGPSPVVTNGGECNAVSVGAAQGATTAAVTITATLSGFTDSTTLTVNAGTGPPMMSPNTVSLDLGASQWLYSKSISPLTGIHSGAGTTYQIIIPAGGSGAGGAFGTLSQGSGSCIYTAPTSLPTVSSNGSSSTITQVEIQASDNTDCIVNLL